MFILCCSLGNIFHHDFVFVTAKCFITFMGQKLFSALQHNFGIVFSVFMYCISDSNKNKFPHTIWLQLLESPAITFNAKTRHTLMMLGWLSSWSSLISLSAVLFIPSAASDRLPNLI